MPRKRMIDPSIWTDEGMAELTPRQQLLYIGLFSNADDDGRLNGSASAIRLMLPGVYGGVLKGEVDADLAAVLREMRQVVVYDADGRRYLAIRKFRVWQKVDHPTPSMLPAPPEDSPEVTEASPNAHRTLPEASGITRASLISLEEENLINPPGGSVVATNAAPPTAVPKKARGPDLAPLVDAFRAIGLPDPVFEGGESRAAQDLLRHYPPEVIAACWQDHASGDYGGALDKQKLSFRWLLTHSPVGNWQRWKAAPHSRNGHGKTGLRGPGGRQEFTTAQLIVDGRRNNIAVDTDAELEQQGRLELLAEVQRLEAAQWHP